MISAPGGEMSPRLIVGTRGLIGLGGGLIVMILVAGAAAVQAERNTLALQRASDTQSLRNLVSEVLISAQNAETGARGYMLTNNPDYLGPFKDADARLPQQLSTLQAAIPSYPELAVLHDAAIARLTKLHQTIEMVAAGGTSAAVNSARTDAGRREMIRLRGAVTAVSGRLDRLLNQEADAIREGGQALVVIDVIGLLLVIALASLIAIGVRAYLADLAKARQAARDAYLALELNNSRLDEAVRERTADLVAANEEIQRFAYIVSHDLRAPLVNIMGFTSELEHATGVLAGYTAGADLPGEVREAAVDEIPEALRFIKASTSKMDRLINAILKLSREGRRVLTAEPLDMRGVIEAAADSMGHQALSVEISIGDLPAIIADRIATEQVFGNIIDNALKYLDPERPGRIGVTGVIEGALVRYDVSDNGRGIDKRDFERVFELFRRAGQQVVPGEGIGLAHVRALVRRMGGSIECDSALGVGSKFTVRLPLEANYARNNG